MDNALRRQRPRSATAMSLAHPPLSSRFRPIYGRLRRYFLRSPNSARRYFLRSLAALLCLSLTSLLLSIWLRPNSPQWLDDGTSQFPASPGSQRKSNSPLNLVDRPAPRGSSGAPPSPRSCGSRRRPPFAWSRGYWRKMSDTRVLFSGQKVRRKSRACWFRRRFLFFLSQLFFEVAGTRFSSGFYPDARGGNRAVFFDVPSVY
jgi:hypothetical protein